MAINSPQNLHNDPNIQEEQDPKIADDSMSSHHSAGDEKDAEGARTPTSSGDRSVEYVSLLKKHLDFVEGEFQSLKQAQRYALASMTPDFDQSLIACHLVIRPPRRRVTRA